MRACVRMCAYIRLYDYCIISLYIRAQFVSTRVRTCVRTCVRTYVHANIHAYVCAGACASASARV